MKFNILKTNYTIIFILLFTISCNNSKDISEAIIYTELGNIKIEIYNEKAPLTARNFSEYIRKGSFDGALFYRTVRPDNQPENKVKIEVIQGGLEFSGSNFELPAIHHENTQQTGLKHLNGTISMARADTGTVTSEFFICIGNQPELDFGGKRNPDLQGFAAFGKVVEGMEYVLAIQQLPDLKQLLIKPVSIDSIRFIK